MSSEEKAKRANDISEEQIQKCAIAGVELLSGNKRPPADEDLVLLKRILVSVASGRLFIGGKAPEKPAREPGKPPQKNGKE